MNAPTISKEVDMKNEKRKEIVTVYADDGQEQIFHISEVGKKRALTISGWMKALKEKDYETEGILKIV